jgi:uncharacterized protein YggE
MVEKRQKGVPGRPPSVDVDLELYGYVATQSVVLRTQAVKEFGTLVGLIGRAEGLSPRIDGFTVRDSWPQQQEAIIAAFADAATKAAAIAAATHVQLGPVLRMDSAMMTSATNTMSRHCRTTPQVE